MLFRLDNPRLILNAQEFPENMVVYCLAYDGCPGDLAVHYLDSSRRVTEEIQPTRQFDILQGMRVNEYVLPFDRLHDSLGRRGATAGFNIVARSSFRVAAASYGTRTLDMTMVFPIIGGGIIRISAGGQEWDIANPTFNPNAPIPAINRSYGAGRGDEYTSGPPGIDNMRVPDEVVINAYRRTHQGYAGASGSEIERRRQERLANFDLQEAREEQPSTSTGPLPFATPAVSGRTSVSNTGRNPNASAEAEARRQQRQAQIQAASARQEGISLGDAPPQEARIIVPATRAPKAPPKTRLERTTEEEGDE